MAPGRVPLKCPGIAKLDAPAVSGDWRRRPAERADRAPGRCRAGGGACLAVRTPPAAFRSSLRSQESRFTAAKRGLGFCSSREAKSILPMVPGFFGVLLTLLKR